MRDAHVATVTITRRVVVTVNNPDAVERITGPGGDEWRSQFYDLHTEADVIEHFAYNAATNGVRRVNQLDGWADLPDDAVEMVVTTEDAEAEVTPLFAAAADKETR